MRAFKNLNMTPLDNEKKRCIKYYLNIKIGVAMEILTSAQTPHPHKEKGQVFRGCEKLIYHAEHDFC
jgi:hypothetical protein